MKIYTSHIFLLCFDYLKNKTNVYDLKIMNIPFYPNFWCYIIFNDYNMHHLSHPSGICSLVYNSYMLNFLSFLVNDNTKGTSNSRNRTFKKMFSIIFMRMV